MQKIKIRGVVAIPPGAQIAPLSIKRKIHANRTGRMEDIIANLMEEYRVHRAYVLLSALKTLSSSKEHIK